MGTTLFAVKVESVTKAKEVVLFVHPTQKQSGRVTKNSSMAERFSFALRLLVEAQGDDGKIRACIPEDIFGAIPSARDVLESAEVEAVKGGFRIAASLKEPIATGICEGKAWESAAFWDVPRQWESASPTKVPSMVEFQKAKLIRETQEKGYRSFFVMPSTDKKSAIVEEGLGGAIAALTRIIDDHGHEPIELRLVGCSQKCIDLLAIRGVPGLRRLDLGNMFVDCTKLWSAIPALEHLGSSQGVYGELAHPNVRTFYTLGQWDEDVLRSARLPALEEIELTSFRSDLAALVPLVERAANFRSFRYDDDLDSILAMAVIAKPSLRVLRVRKISDEAIDALIAAKPPLEVLSIAVKDPRIKARLAKAFGKAYRGKV
ncbi:MAG: hypothetical protein ACKV2T_07405 [Kofleriaceae bacterium]